MPSRTACRSNTGKSSAPAKHSPTLYGEKKNINFSTFNIGRVLKAITKFEGDKKAFVEHPEVTKQLAKINAKEKALATLKKEIQVILKDRKKYKDARGNDIRAVTGTFGLRVMRHELK